MDIVTLAMAKAYSDKKGGYVENAIVMPRQELELVYSEDDLVFEVIFNPAPFVPVAGTDYIVKWDGVEYKCTCLGDETFLAFGNVGAMSGESTGEPFLVIYRGGTLSVSSVDATEQVTVTVEIIAETIVPIDPKYLPGVCLPVVRLSTTFKPSSQFTDEESKILTAAFEKNTPVVIMCNVDVDNFGTLENTALVWCPAISGNFQAFAASLGGLMLQIVDIDSSGKWLCNVQ